MKRNVLIGVVAAVAAIVVIAPLGYGFAQRAAIASLDFDFDRFELTDINFSETQSFGSMQRIVANAEQPSVSMLQDINSLQTNIASPQTFALDLIANTRLTYSMFVDVHNPSSFEAVIDRAQIEVSINGNRLATPLLLDQQYRIGAGQTVEVELKGISVNGKEIASLLYNLASDDFVLTIDFAITSYFPTLFGEMPVPANVNVQMYLIPPKPIYRAFEQPVTSGVQQVAYEPGSNIYKLSFANENNVPISGKFEIGVLKGNFLSGIGLCDPACFAPIDNGFATFMRVKGSSLFDVQVIESQQISLNSHESYDFDVENPVLRSNAKTAFVMRWAPDYDKTPYLIKASVMGIEKTSTGEFVSSDFSIVKKIAYNIVNDFGYVGAQEFISPDKSTLLTLRSSDLTTKEGDTISFSGKLTDAYGRGVANKRINIMENDPLNEDDFLARATTDNSGDFQVSWTARNADFDDVLDIFATFEGDLYYDESRSRQIGVEVSTSAFSEPDLEGTRLTIFSDTDSATIGQFIHFSGRLTDDSGRGIPNKTIQIKEADTIGDDLLGTAFTDSQGYYTFDWQAEDDGFGDSEVFAEFRGDSTYSAATSSEVSIAIDQEAYAEPSIQQTSISLYTSANAVYEGDYLEFSGQLIDSFGDGIPNALIYIKDEDSFDIDDEIGYAYTEMDGSFAALWQAEWLDDDDTIELYAVFEGSNEYSEARSIEREIQILTNEQQAPEQQYQTTGITIDVSSQVVDEGDMVTISGRLIDESGDGVANALIYLKDEDTGSGDDVLGTVFTNSNGDYVFSWQATYGDPFDNVVEIYTVFEGSQYYSQARSTQINVQVN